MNIAQTSPPAERPWAGLDPSLAKLLAPGLPALADEIIAAIGAAVPDYQRPMEGAFGRGVRNAIEQALRQFLELIARPGGDRRAPRDGSAREVYLALGRGEFRAGRRLDALQAAYRIGARLAWRRVSATARAAGADADTLSLLAESIFAYIEEISAESVEGYAAAQAEVAGEQQRRRQLLVRALVAGEPADEPALQQAAIEAGWPLPRAVAALACADVDPERLATRLGSDAIAARVDGVSCALVPDPDAPRRRAELARAVGRASAALGPTTGWREGSISYERARQCLRLQAEGVLPDRRLLVADEQLGALMVLRDEALAQALARRRLAPLDGVTAAQRERAERTLLSWLRHQGEVAAVAAELHVHRQTVRYRLARLRELFGAALDDPDARFELELALRARALGAGARR